MAQGPRYHTQFRRRTEGKTDFRRRLGLLKSRQARIVVRKKLNNVIVQVVDYSPQPSFRRLGRFVQGFERLGGHGAYRVRPMPVPQLAQRLPRLCCPQPAQTPGGLVNQQPVLAVGGRQEMGSGFLVADPAQSLSRCRRDPGRWIQQQGLQPWSGYRTCTPEAGDASDEAPSTAQRLFHIQFIEQATHGGAIAYAQQRSGSSLCQFALGAFQQRPQ